MRERRASTFRFGGGTSFDPVRSTRVLQVHRSLGPDHSLNTPRCTCRGIIHCLYFPLPPPPLFLSPVALIYRPWRFFPRPSRVSISFLLLSRFFASSFLLLHPLSRFARGEPSSATRHAPNVSSPLVLLLLLVLLLATIEIHRCIRSLTLARD